MYPIQPTTCIFDSCASPCEAHRYDGTIFYSALKALEANETLGGFAWQVLGLAEACCRGDAELPEDLRVFVEAWLNLQDATRLGGSQKYVTPKGDIYSDDDLMAY